jgi:DNA-binding LacI/PurR family transcriptional regulator
MNIQKFAQEAGVSSATVSRAFHEPEKLKEKTRERVLSLAAKFGYYPDPSGRALVRGRHEVLGLIWPLEAEGSQAVFAHRILALLTDQLVKNDLDLLICPIHRDQIATLDHAHRTLRRSRCDAWILLYPRRNDPLTEPLIASHKPVVCLMGDALTGAGWKCVKLNQQNWIEDCLRRLNAAGARSVVLVGGRAGEPDHEERRRAFESRAPKQFGNRVTVVAGWPLDEGALLDCLARGEGTGIIGVDDSAALLALEVCKKARLAVPKNVKVVGVDDSPLAAMSEPPLSTYRQPLDEMVECAVDLALGRRRQSRRFDAVFVPRSSLPG